MAAPSVYTAITAVSAELATAGIPKIRLNAADDYHYRSIDDVVGALSPLLSKHRLCVLPRVLERTAVERAGVAGPLSNVALRVAFDLVSSEDGTSHQVQAYGEALDPGDKATAKAMSAAYKAAMLQTFCIPIAGQEDADATSHKLGIERTVVEPVQGWDQWALDIGDIVNVCESLQAIDLVQDRNRSMLAAINRERPDLYGELGRTFTARREKLSAAKPQREKPRPSRKQRNGTTRTASPTKTAHE